MTFIRSLVAFVIIACYGCAARLRSRKCKKAGYYVSRHL